MGRRLGWEGLDAGNGWPVLELMLTYAGIETGQGWVESWAGG
jgi:hypothetical protein